ncbi:transporter substrate-binding domain-containing protein [Breoghania sp.]|uniref:transporter substrate-binding domain-containing protein n=1 Tax=Breoghania sp. TaxID=2065378 RepID=UPI0026207A83|nr:transporter substrate-binding domain-containing protein [Breoghania sp.]MDJ0930587.1 transporter substrate-binding domain-containing protein [Breoghania sp.]
MGDASKISMVKATTQTRFSLLQTGEVDIVTANATWTLSRDAELGLDATVTTFYDGQGFMVPKSLGVTKVSELDGADLCVPPDPTPNRSPPTSPRRKASPSTRS